MAKTAAWMLASAVVFATAGVAHAQETLAPADAASADTPWYQRFTTSTGLTEAVTGVTENDRALTPEWTLSQRWGVTVDVREAQRLDRGPDVVRNADQTAVGAYYQFTPRVRVGGQVSVETPQNLTNSTAGRREETEPSAGVRLQSAFRF